MNKETIETVEVAEKPYKFRDLCAKDIPLMTNVIKAIGLREFKPLLTKERIDSLLNLAKANKGEKAETAEGKLDYAAVGFASVPIVLDIIEILLNNLDACGKALFKLLAETSNLSFEKVEKLSLTDFASMVTDFVKKEEFSDFFKLVLKSFNRAK